MLKPGDTAPEFEVTATGGKRLRLADYRGQKNVVLYFYPKDGTRVCTAEACGFRDIYSELASADTEVIGVSADSDSSHERFADRHQVPFPLVADRDRSLARRYQAAGGVVGFLGLTQRVTYVIDKQGRIAAAFDSMFDASTHLDGVRKTLAQLATSGGGSSG